MGSENDVRGNDDQGDGIRHGHHGHHGCENGCAANTNDGHVGDCEKNDDEENEISRAVRSQT
jgi:hypothetical protein